MERYNVVFGVDENYIQHLAVAILSLLMNNNDSKFNIYIICSKLSEEHFNKLRLITDKYEAEIEKIVIHDERLDNIALTYHFTKANYYRLFIPNFIEENKVLYLDADIVVNGPVKDLFSIDLDDNYVAAVLNPGFKRHQELGMDLDSAYFNSGVMLINNKLWKKDNICDNVIEYTKENPGRIQFVDQDGLNAIINGKWIKLPLKYNLQSVVFEKDFKERYNCFSENELEEAKKNPVIIHYTGSSKPWHFRNKHPYKHLYWKYLKMTPFKRYIPEDLTVVNVIKWMIPKSIKEYIKKYFF